MQKQSAEDLMAQGVHRKDDRLEAGRENRHVMGLVLSNSVNMNYKDEYEKFQNS